MTEGLTNSSYLVKDIAFMRKRFADLLPPRRRKRIEIIPISFNDAAPSDDDDRTRSFT